MPLTQSEKSKRYREKLKRTNPEKYLDTQRKNKLRALKSYQNKKLLMAAQKKEHENKLLKRRKEKDSLQQTVRTMQSTSSVKLCHMQHQNNTEDGSNEKDQKAQNILPVQVRGRYDQNETDSPDQKEEENHLYLSRTMIRNMQRSLDKKMRRETNKLRESVQKLMRGYNSLQRRMRRLKNDYQDLAKKVQEKEAETDKHTIGQEQEYTPYKRSENFVNEHLTNVATPEKQTIKKKILEYNVLTDSIKSKFNTCQNPDKNTLKDVVDSPIVKKYKLKTYLTKSLGLKYSLKRHLETKTKTRNLIQTIRRFYERDDVSRASAGKKECRTLKKCKMQVRYLLDKLETLHKKYVSEVGPISLSTFKKYRPFYVICPNLKDLETCGCLKHCNMQFVVNALKSAGILESNDINTILANLVCDLDFKQCMYGECSVCKDDIQVNGEEKGEIKWFSWNVKEHKYDEKGESKKTKRMTKTENKGTLKDLVDLYNKEIKKFKIHVFNMRHQYQQYKLCIKNLDYNECAIHIDFSENWLCKHHEEVQAMHFGASKRQITLHTGVLYIKNEKPISFCTISPENSHNPEAIWAHLDPVLKLVRSTYSTIDTVHFFSDGPTSQYRQKKNFFLMSRNTYEHGFKNYTWSFFEASHGKGAADGVGGTIKRTLDFKVSHGIDIPDAQTAFNVLEETATSIKIFFIKSDTIQALDTSIINKLTPIRNTLKIHQIVSNAKFILNYRNLSCFCKNSKGKCDCFEPEIHSFEDTDTKLNGKGKDKNGIRLELDETTGELRQVRKKRYENIEIKENKMLSGEEQLFNWTQDCYLSDNIEVDETNIDINILNDSGILNAMELENDPGETKKHVEKDSKMVTYNPDSLYMLCMKAINIHLNLPGQNTKAQLPGVCVLNKISKSDGENLPFKVMNDNDLPKCLQPRISPSMLSENKLTKSASSSKLIIFSNVKVDVRSEVKKNDIKKILKGAEVVTQSALQMKIFPKKKDINVEQNNSLRQTDTLNEQASTTHDIGTNRKRKNMATEIIRSSKSSMSKETDNKRKRKNVTTEKTTCGKKDTKTINNREKSKLSKKTVKNKNKRTFIETSSENSDILSLAESDNSEYETFDEYISTCLEDQVEKENLEPATPTPLARENDFLKEDDWIVAQFATKKSLKYFVGRVLWIKDNVPTIKFVRKVKNSKGSRGLIFTYPNVEDVCEMQLNDVIKILPQPNISRRGQIHFDTDISQYNIQ